MHASATFPPDPRAAREARHLAEQWMHEWGCAEADMLVSLLVTELITNSVLHARTTIELSLTLLDDAIRMEVRDGSVAAPARRRHSLDATTGRGLALVDDLSRQWGVDVAADGKTVWAEIPRAGDLDGDIGLAHAGAGSSSGAARHRAHTRPDSAVRGGSTLARCA